MAAAVLEDLGLAVAELSFDKLRALAHMAPLEREHFLRPSLGVGENRDNRDVARKAAIPGSTLT